MTNPDGRTYHVVVASDDADFSSVVEKVRLNGLEAIADRRESWAFEGHYPKTQCEAVTELFDQLRDAVPSVGFTPQQFGVFPFVVQSEDRDPDDPQSAIVIPENEQEDEQPEDESPGLQLVRVAWAIKPVDMKVPTAVLVSELKPGEQAFSTLEWMGRLQAQATRLASGVRMWLREVLAFQGMRNWTKNSATDPLQQLSDGSFAGIAGIQKVSWLEFAKANGGSI